jgi:hypothetical protein
MRVGIIGAGRVGPTLGRGWVAAGHQVIYGVRDPGAARLHEGATAAHVHQLIEATDAVVLATPWSAVPDVVVLAGDFRGRALIDVTNPIGPGFSLLYGHVSSGAEHVASIANDARVAKAFNSTGLENMANPRYGAHRAFMPVASDDEGARDVAAQLARDLGFEAVALPSLSRARDLEPFAMLWIKLAMQLGHGRDIAFGLARRAGPERPASSRAAQPRAITIAGAGNIGGALARAWLRAGHAVTLAVRDANADDVRPLVALGAKAVPVAGAAAGVAAQLGDLAGKVVVDATNAITRGLQLAYGHTTSSAEELAKALPGARVVRSFNQQGAETLENPLFGDLRAVNFVAGDDAAARSLVRSLSEDVGLDSVEAGPLSTSRYLEPLTTLWIATSQVLGTRQFAFALLRR